MLDYSKDQERIKLLNQFRLEKVLLKYKMLEEIFGLYNRDTLLNIQLRLIDIDNCIKYLEYGIITPNIVRKMQCVFNRLVQDFN